MTERKIYERDRHDADGHSCLLRPQGVTGGTWYTTTVDMEGFDRAMICVLGGAVERTTPDGVPNNCTLAVRVGQCSGPNINPTPPVAAAAGFKNLAGLAGAKLISDSGMGNYSYSGSYYYGLDRKWLLHVKAEEMDVDAGFRFLQVEYIVSANCTWYLAMEAIRSTAGYEPVATTNITQVVA